MRARQRQASPFVPAVSSCWTGNRFDPLNAVRGIGDPEIMVASPAPMPFKNPRQ
jgi:hypothetical protein